MRFKRNPVITIIKEVTGLSIQKFCEDELLTKYPAFSTRLKEGKLYPSEIFYIVHRTGKSVDELFGRPWHELLITDQGGPIANKVSNIIDKLKPKEKESIEKLLGFDFYFKKKDLADQKNTSIKKKAEKEDVIDLKSIFKSTY